MKILALVGYQNNILSNIAKDAISALIELSQDVFTLELKDITEDRKKVVPLLFNTALRFKPDFIFTINIIGLFTPEFLEKLRIPWVTWFVDNPFLFPLLFQKSSFRESRRSHLFIWDKAYIDPLKKEGFKNVYYLPLATNPKIFKELSLTKDEVSKYECDISFVGRCNFSVGYREKKEELLKIFQASVMEEIIDLQSKDPLIPITEIYEDIKKKHGLLQETENVTDYLLSLEFEAMTRYRKDMIRAISNFGVHLYGDPEWKELVNKKIKWFGHIDYNELPFLYNATKVNLNLTKSQLKTAINQRVFDVSSCGSFVLSDFREDLVRLFREGEEVVYFKDKKDLKEKVKYYLRNEKERKEIAKRAQKRVLQEHTFFHRMKEVIELMKGQFS